MQARASTVSPIGTTTIPKRTREALGLESGGRIEWRLGADGQLLVRVKHRYPLQGPQIRSPGGDEAIMS